MKETEGIKDLRMKEITENKLRTLNIRRASKS